MTPRERERERPSLAQDGPRWSTKQLTRALDPAIRPIVPIAAVPAVSYEIDDRSLAGSRGAIN